MRFFADSHLFVSRPKSKFSFLSHTMQPKAKEGIRLSGTKNEFVNTLLLYQLD